MSGTWRPAYVAIGANLGDPRASVRTACQMIATLADTRLVACSRAYRSRPMGPQDQPDYVNAAAGVLTLHDARSLLALLLDIERSMGRDRRERWGPRIIDLDLVWMAGTVIDEPSLRVPHPGVRDRNFVLYPLDDIAPTLRIPGCGRVSDLKRRVGDAGLSVLEDE
ncbi:MAG: 2-amino-4-hydroxy-6-hydroxymethyldihydropteridine diphosphokinase [Gammaproteobacteria bacterium]|nr:2-amino-4-hydroxy-6-hydroxymethyldihydropteridine diphosphokinase [Gammaproteobacteria bacterium]MDE2349605.1 2-amino-4-hydroxy-6-hydroxymethyldihydropteridine diphosphokinase [Gammaproteobacteria bacterium]